MNSYLPFTTILLILLQVLGIANGIANGEEAVQIECLPTSIDLDSFRCIPSGSTRVPCIDEEKRCPEWSAKGECKKNPRYMLVHCRKSCSSCIPLHSGDQPQLARDETRSKVLERLYETQEYLHKQADMNIANLKSCVNKHAECTHWWSIGECEKNPRFMTSECGPACQSC